MLSPVFQHDTRYVYIEDKYQSGLSQVCSTTDSGEIFERKKERKLCSQTTPVDLFWFVQERRF